MAEDKRPQWFKVWARNRVVFDNDSFSYESVGKAFINAVRYFAGEQDLIKMSPAENAIYLLLKQGADEAISEYKKAQENGKKGGQAKARNRQHQEPASALEAFLHGS